MKTFAETQKKYGAVMGDWRGVKIAFYYTSLKVENQAAMERIGLFHIGNNQELFVYGKDARKTLEFLGTGSLENIKSGDTTPFIFCNEKGGLIGSVNLVCLGEDSFLLIMLSSQTKPLKQWIDLRKLGDCEILNNTGSLVHFALTGKKALEFLDTITRNYPKTRGKATQKCYISGIDCTILRENLASNPSFQIIAPQNKASILWEYLMERGKEFDIQPCGAMISDVLRIEMGLPVSGKEVTIDANPFDIGFGQYVDFSKEKFIGKNSLKELSKRHKILTGLTIQGVPKAVTKDEIYKKGISIGKITSSSYSFFYETPIAMAILDYDNYKVGDILQISGSNSYTGTVQSLPFYME